MTPEEYFGQAYRLDQRINSNIAEVARLREMSTSISSPSFEEHYNPNRPAEASFVHILEKVWELEQEINDEIDRFVDLKAQMKNVIDALHNADERMVLTYRYIHNMTWPQIATKLYASPSTVRRWHKSALQHICLPKNFIDIRNVDRNEHL